MDGENMYNDISSQRGNYEKLGQWLQGVLATPDADSDSTRVQEDELIDEKGVKTAIAERNTPLHPALGADYHISFYQQLPDFCTALLQQDPQATVKYASLLFHLAGCPTCHAAYLDIYGSLQMAFQAPDQNMRPLFRQGTRTLAATPHRMLCHLSQTLISQAEALLRQGHREHIDNDEAARSLLQLAMRVSTHIVQSALRRQALQDLVRVATLFAGPTAPMTSQESQEHTFKPVSVAGSVRRARAEQSLHGSSTDRNIIHLQSLSLSGSVQQQGEQLTLHLQNLPQSMRGHFVLISVPVGELSERIRWQGGDCKAIRSVAVVDEQGTLVTPLGETDLQLSKPEERNFVEALVLQLAIQRID